MSSKIVVLLVLVSCLYMHMYACNAGRVLGFSVKESGSQIHDSVNEGVEKVWIQLSETTSMPSSTWRPSMLVEVKNPETVVTHEKADFSRKQGESATRPTSSGHDIITLSTSSQIDLQYQVELKGLKRQARSVLGSAKQDNDIEEDHNTDSEGSSNEAAIDEDVGVMDYANPHRKPPIHNQKP
ncbi:hypothetical protein RchiOBHm_Chr7g0202891 [Rosa chinensis]|uniref:Uncharacterized protein n=1 Tax=Rosa chinensis TaxID=74649 RepID=A0A2P6P8B0_ROSCH|nr:uncharacterized protein LOC112175179 [Rosa chinensis]PRQ18159.1 hypothetical protein RchiOBHm_Chr7g0202891 [Rosa chinensis]